MGSVLCSLGIHRWIFINEEVINTWEYLNIYYCAHCDRQKSVHHFNF